MTERTRAPSTESLARIINQLAVAKAHLETQLLVAQAIVAEQQAELETLRNERTTDAHHQP